MDAQTNAAMDRMVSARVALVLEEPFFGVLSMRLELVPDPTCERAWVDGVHLGFNPAWVLQQTHDRLVATLVHEVMHCAHGHPWRRMGRDMERWNRACDYAINPEIVEAGYRLPDNVLLDEQYAGHFAEWICDRLPDEQAPDAGESGEDGADDEEGDDDGQGQGQGDDDGQEGASDAPGDDDGDGDGDGSEGPGDDDDGDGSGESQDDAQDGDGGQGSGTGEGEGADDAQAPGDGAQTGPADEGQEPQKRDVGGEMGELRDAPVESSAPENSEADWQRAVQEAAMAAKAHGQLPGSLERFAKRCAEPKVMWRPALRRFAQEVARHDYSWRAPNRSYVAHDLYLPSLAAEGMGAMAVCIDTSGSIDAIQLGKYEAEVNAIVDELQPLAVHVIYCDTRVTHTDVFGQGEPVVFVHRGGGGTDFRPALAAVADLEPQPVCVIYFTDLYGDFPEQEPDVPVLWGATSNAPAPWGEIIRIDD